MRLLSLGIARCSTDEQAEALQAQVTRLREAGCDHIIEELISGKKQERAGLMEAIALVRAKKVREVVVVRIDRLTRTAQEGDQFIALCDLLGVSIRALDGGEIEAATPQGFMMARMMTTMAEVESRMLSQRLRKQFEVYRAQGRHLRRRKPFGYVGGADHKLEPDPDNWDHALRVLQELREVRSFSGVANRLPDWCPWTPAASNLQAWFCNPAIRGHIGHHKTPGKGWSVTWKEMHYDQHPALIGEAEWQELAALLKRKRNNFAKSVHAVHGLTGLLQCSSCGHRLRRNSAQGVVWWRCRHRLCNARAGIKEEDAMAFAVQACVKAAKDLAKAVAMPSDESPYVAAKRRDLEQLQELARRNPALEVGVQALRDEIEGMSRREVVLPDLEPFELIATDPMFYEMQPPEIQRSLLHAVLASVQVPQATGLPVAIPRNF
jgi:DNA invertase Pin-like site-specific DNA recombinase